MWLQFEEEVVVGKHFTQYIILRRRAERRNMQNSTVDLQNTNLVNSDPKTHITIRQVIPLQMAARTSIESAIKLIRESHPLIVGLLGLPDIVFSSS